MTTGIITGNGTLADDPVNGSGLNMKVFVFNFDGAKDWVLSHDKERAEEFYKNETSNWNLDGYEVTELSEKQMKEHYILDPNETEPDPEEEEYNEDDYCNGCKVIESFYNYALDENNHYSHIICSNEY